MQIQVKELKSILNKVKNFSKANNKTKNASSQDLINDTIFFYDSFIYALDTYKSIRIENNTNIIGSFSIKKLNNIVKINDNDTFIDLESYNTNNIKYRLPIILHDDKTINDFQYLTINKNVLIKKLKTTTLDKVTLKFKDWNNEFFQISLNRIYLNNVLSVLKGEINIYYISSTQQLYFRDKNNISVLLMPIRLNGNMDNTEIIEL